MCPSIHTTDERPNPFASTTPSLDFCFYSVVLFLVGRLYLPTPVEIFGSGVLSSPLRESHALPCLTAVSMLGFSFLSVAG